MRLRGALVRFRGHDRVGNQVDREGEQLRNDPELETEYLTKIHSMLAPFAEILRTAGFEPATRPPLAALPTELRPRSSPARIARETPGSFQRIDRHSSCLWGGAYIT